MKNYYYRMGVLLALFLPFHFFAQYCTPTFSTGCSVGDYIDGVQMGTINNTGTGCSTGSYGNYVLTQTTSVNQALSYNISVTLNPTYGQGIGVFIDWNQNFDFNDPGEFYSNNVVTPGGGTEVINITVPVSATLGNTRMRVICSYANTVAASGSCGGTTYGEAEDYGITVNAAPSCLPPTNVSASNVMANTADVSWTIAAGAVDHDLEWGPVGFAPGTGAQSGSQSGVVGATTTITGLSPQTDYDVYVRSDCGSSESPWAGPASFTTACTFEIAPWTENFTTTVTPNCWSQSAQSGGPWVFTGNPGYTASGTLDHTNGSQNNYAWIDHSGTDVGVVLESPLVDVNNLNVPELRFWIWSHYNGSLNPYNPTYIEAYDGSTWQQLGVVQGDFGPQWTEFYYVIPPAYIFGTGQVKVRFRAESGGSSSDFYNDILLDDVSIVEAPTCPQPINLTLDDSDSNSAILSWMATGSETEWQFEYGPVGFTPGSGTNVTANSNPDTISGLMANSFYEVYVRAVCTPGDSSFWSGPIAFDTYGLGQYMEMDLTCNPDGFVDISTMATANALTADGESGFNLPFPFYFQGNAVTQVTVGNNGVVLFNTISGQVSAFNSNTIASSAAEGLYPFWDDLDDNNAQIYWTQVGNSPNSQFIVQWNAKHDSYSAGVPFVFQVVMDEATGQVFYSYLNDITGSTSYDLGNSATIGLKGPNQNFPVSYNSTGFLSENDCARFYYTKCPKPTDLIFQYITSNEAAISWTAGLTGETNWTVVYGPAGFDPNTGGTSQTVTNNSAPLLGLDQLTEYDVYVYADCDNGNQSFALMGNFTTLPLCSNPTNLSATTSIDSIFTDWNWVESDPMYPSTGFEITYGNLGFDPTNGGMIDLSDASNFTDTTDDATLMAGGVYDVYIRAVCDTLVSGYVGPVSVTMPLTNDAVCMPQALPVDGSVNYFNNSGATIESNEQTIAPPATGNQETDGWGNNTIARSTWFTFIAPASGEMRIDATNEPYNGQIAVYEVVTCSDFNSFNLLAANDDDLGGLSLAPNFTVCGLTPGAEYYLLHDSYNNSTGNYAIKLSAINLDAGSPAGVVDVCYRDTVNLFTAISGYQSGGTWNDIDLTYHIVNDSLFNTTGLAAETYQFEYQLKDGCAEDAVIASVQIYPESKAGTDGTLEICKNEPTGLFDGLGGTYDAGGTWFDANNQAKATSNVEYGELNVAGQYNFTYIVGNGVCPNDTSIVSVSVLASCDFTGLEEGEITRLSVHPNPTSGIVYLQSNSELDYSVEVRDINGKLIQTLSNEKLNGVGLAIDLSDVESGVYLINVVNNQTTKTMRIMRK